MELKAILCMLLLIGVSSAAFNHVIRAPQCLPMADVGPCDGKVRVFGYDYVSNRCVHFYYGGCGGNPNRFATRKECMDTCFVVNAEGQDEVEDARFAELYKDEL